MLIINVPRIVLYLLMIGLVLWGSVPWWVVVSVVLYDIRWVKVFQLPRWMLSKPKAPEWEPLPAPLGYVSKIRPEDIN